MNRSETEQYAQIRQVLYWYICSKIISGIDFKLFIYPIVLNIKTLCNIFDNDITNCYYLEIKITIQNKSLYR